jgi:2'-phosphotransferase
MLNMFALATQGLSKMTRQHIHLAQGVAGDGAISGTTGINYLQSRKCKCSRITLSSRVIILGMRKSSQILIYVDIESALRAGLKFYLSQNGVVLTPGDERGMLGPEFFSKVEKANGTPVPGWIRPELKEMRTNADVLCGDNSSTAQTGNTLQTDGVLHS